jgi:hypothetical protein
MSESHPRPPPVDRLFLGAIVLYVVIAGAFATHFALRLFSEPMAAEHR